MKKNIKDIENISPQPTIAVLEDSEFERKMLSKHLAPLANVVEENIHSIIDNLTSYDLIILSYEYKNERTEDILDKICTSPNSFVPPVLVTTMSDTKSVVSSCLDSGASDTIIKPIEPVVFIARVTNKLELSRINRHVIESTKDFWPKSQFAFVTKLAGVAASRLEDQVNILSDSCDLINHSPQSWSRMDTKSIIANMSSTIKSFRTTLPEIGIEKRPVPESRLNTIISHCRDLFSTPSNEDRLEISFQPSTSDNMVWELNYYSIVLFRLLLLATEQINTEKEIVKIFTCIKDSFFCIDFVFPKNLDKNRVDELFSIYETSDLSTFRASFDSLYSVKATLLEKGGHIYFRENSQMTVRTELPLQVEARS